MLPDRATRGFSQPLQEQAIQSPGAAGLGQGRYQSGDGEQHIGPDPLLAAEIGEEQIKEEQCCADGSQRREEADQKSEAQ